MQSILSPVYVTQVLEQAFFFFFFSTFVCVSTHAPQTINHSKSALYLEKCSSPGVLVCRKQAFFFVLMKIMVKDKGILLKV